MNLGVIGTGWITEAFIEGAQSAGVFEPLAVYSRHEDKAAQFARKHKLAYTYTNLEQMATAEDIDVVYIGSPNALHYEQAVLFLQNNKHVICEKPIFSNTAEWEQAHQTAEKHGVYLFEAMRHIHSPNLEEIKNRIGDLGTIRSVILPFVQYSSRYEKYKNGERPNVFTAEFSGGALVDLGVYPLALAVALFGKPEDTVYSPVQLETGVDGSGTLVLKYPNMVCTILCSKVAQSYQACEIHGDTGTMTFEGASEMHAAQLIRNDTKEAEALGTETYANNMNFEAEAFYHIIQHGDRAYYEKLNTLSYTVLSITEKVRKENGIVFGVEQ
ncbi:putative oxidoreductase [Lentibacillus sp. JNUCC-1]|uniref:Gfo/Idh/MocA family protein n=1 Tax=Lentibacillus sp. JNUCC-1 TaxID=2654513 RepID=UPI0012E930D7|nr:Gfo/Idh/MocA family oxidoreductase [Lentibacillus sp. JNUCC-1]MUV37731.1 putative oxidoreductase [Lentibacillus sp. JNUCC-1]